MRKLVFAFLVVTLGICFLSLLLIKPISADPAVYVTITVVEEEVEEGSNFVAYVDIDDVINFDSASYNITYDPDVLEVTGVFGGEIGSTFIPVVEYTLIPKDVQGRVWIRNNVTDAPGVNGSGYLAEIRLHVVGIYCNWSDIEFIDGSSFIYDNSTPPKVIDANWIDDRVHVGATPSPTMTPSPTATPSLSLTASPTITLLPTATATVTGVPTVSGTPTKSPTATPTTSPTPTLAVIINAPAEVDEDGNFSATVDIINVDETGAANYSLQYVIAYDEDIVAVTDVDEGEFASTAIPITDWDLVPTGTQGVVAIMQNISTTSALTGNGYLSVIDFDVVGQHCNTSHIRFNDADCALLRLGATVVELDAAWVDDEVHVVGPTPTATGNVTANVTVSPTPTSTTPAPAGGGGPPGWVWPVVGVMLGATLLLFLLAMYRLGYFAKLQEWFGGGEMEDYMMEGADEGDMYEGMYGDEEPGDLSDEL